MTTTALSVIENILKPSLGKSDVNMLLDFTDEEMRNVSEDLYSDSKPASKVRVTDVMQAFEKRLTEK